MKIEWSSERLVLQKKVYTGETIFLVVFLFAACAGAYYFFAHMGSPVSWWIMLIPLAFGYFTIGMREDVEFEFDRGLHQIRWRRLYYFKPQSGVLNFSDIQTIHQVEKIVTHSDGAYTIYYVDLLRPDNTGVTISHLGTSLEEAQSLVKAIAQVLPQATVQTDNARLLKNPDPVGLGTGLTWR